MDSFEDELRKLLNRHSMENRSDTPDYVLAMFILRCLDAFDDAVVTRTAYRTAESANAAREGK